MAQDPVRVTIVVEGGCVQGVYGGDFVQVVVYDHDVAEENRQYAPAAFCADPESELDADVAAACEEARREA